MSFVSVIVPNYNHAPFLKDRIGSILAQTHQNFELIILDDCSTDNSREIIETYRNNDKIAHIVYNEKNSGSTFKQWKKGIELAKGEWIWIAESDDVAETEFLQTLLSINDNSVFRFSLSSVIDENGSQSHWNAQSTLPTIDQIKLFQENIYLPFICNTLIPNISASIIQRKDIIEKVEFNLLEKKVLTGDQLFYLMLLNKSDDLYFHNQSLNKFRIHEETVRNKIDTNCGYLEGITNHTIILKKDPSLKPIIFDRLAYRLKKNRKLGYKKGIKEFLLFSIRERYFLSALKLLIRN